MSETNDNDFSDVPLDDTEPEESVDNNDEDVVSRMTDHDLIHLSPLTPSQSYYPERTSSHQHQGVQHSESNNLLQEFDPYYSENFGTDLPQEGSSSNPMGYYLLQTLSNSEQTALGQYYSELGVDQPSVTPEQDLLAGARPKVMPSSQTIPHNLSLAQEEVEFLESKGFTPVRELGKGAHGQVYVAMCNQDIEVKIPIEGEESTEGHEFDKTRNCYVKSLSISGEEVAIKRLTQQKAYVNESRILNRVNHPNCIKLYDRFENNNIYYFVLEYLNGGTNMTKFLSKYTEDLDDFTALLMIKHIGLGLKYLHSLGIQHQDLHGDNIMPHCEKGMMIWKIIDFGISSLEGDAIHNIEEDVYDFRDKVVNSILYKLGRDAKSEETYRVIRKVVLRIPESLPVFGFSMPQFKDPNALDTMEKVFRELLPFLPQIDCPHEGTAADKYLKSLSDLK